MNRFVKSYVYDSLRIQPPFFGSEGGRLYLQATCMINSGKKMTTSNHIFVVVFRHFLETCGVLTKAE